MTKYLNVLYISYDGILEPIGKSQVISYLINLSKKHIQFTIISFEKPHSLQDKIKVEKTTDHLLKNNIRWIPLKYHKRLRILATGWDILIGVIVGVSIYSKFKFNIIHSRSFIASLIAFILKLFVKPFFIYDVRGFWSDERLMGNSLNKGFF